MFSEAPTHSVVCTERGVRDNATRYTVLAKPKGKRAVIYARGLAACQRTLTLHSSCTRYAAGRGPAFLFLHFKFGFLAGTTMGTTQLSRRSDVRLRPQSSAD